MDNVRIAANKIDFFKIGLKDFHHKHQRMMNDIHVVRTSFIMINFGFQNRLPNPSCELFCYRSFCFNVLFFQFSISLDR